MTVPLVHKRPEVPRNLRVWAMLAIGTARAMTALPPVRIRQILELLRHGARPAGYRQTLAVRNAVTGLSTLCAGRGCLQRSIATALLCRIMGIWPTWRVGIRTEPFNAHAWVEAEGRPVGEDAPPDYFQPIMTVDLPNRQRHDHSPGRHGTSVESS